MRGGQDDQTPHIGQVSRGISAHAGGSQNQRSGTAQFRAKPACGCRNRKRGIRRKCQRDGRQSGHFAAPADGSGRGSRSREVRPQGGAGAARERTANHARQVSGRAADGAPVRRRLPRRAGRGDAGGGGSCDRRRRGARTGQRRGDRKPVSRGARAWRARCGSRNRKRAGDARQRQRDRERIGRACGVRDRRCAWPAGRYEARLRSRAVQSAVPCPGRRKIAG